MRKQHDARLQSTHLVSRGVWAVLTWSLLTACAPEPAPVVNLAPSADAGADQNVVVGQSVTLSGSGSRDPEDAALTYRWSLDSRPGGSTAALQGADSVAPTLTADAVGDFVVHLVVSDGTSTSTADEVVIHGVSEGTSVPPVTGGSDTPVAQAGADQRALAGETVTVDGSRSADPGGKTLSYAWTVKRKPSGSAVTVPSTSGAVLNMKPDVPGEYELALVVSNGTRTSAPDTVVITVAANQMPTADAGEDHYGTVGESLTLSGDRSRDPEGRPLTYTWAVAVAPQDSHAAVSPTGSAVTFKPDVVGSYRIDLTVSDGANVSPVDSVVIEAGLPMTRLKFRVQDAEYSRALDRMIMVGTEPSQLHIYDPKTGADQAVNLLLPPSSVSVSPDGRYAAVGHNAHISYIDLAAGQLVKTMDVSTDVLDVILAGNGYVYAFPRRDQWESIYSIQVASGQETRSSSWAIYAGTVAKLHPSGKYMYGADNGLSPSDIEKYSIEQGTAQVLYDSPYHGDYPMCGDLWISEDGRRIFTKCGNVFRSSEVAADDMRYNGSLNTSIRSLAHSVSAHEIAVVPELSWNSTGDDTKLKFFNDDVLTPVSELRLPKWKVGATAYPAHGKFVFYNAAADTAYVVVQADESAGTLNDFGIVKVKR